MAHYSKILVALYCTFAILVSVLIENAAARPLVVLDDINSKKIVENTVVLPDDKVLSRRAIDIGNYDQANTEHVTNDVITSSAKVLTDDGLTVIGTDTNMRRATVYSSRRTNEIPNKGVLKDVGPAVIGTDTNMRRAT
eukprot:Awhi_evm1s4265